MMDIAIENAVHSSVFAGVVASAVTVAIERFGGRVGAVWAGRWVLVSVVHTDDEMRLWTLRQN